MTPAAELRMRFLLLRWELAAAQWDDALCSIEGLYGRMARRGILGGPVAGWVFLARAVAQFQTGEGAKYRRSLARVLRAARRARGRRLRDVAIRVGAAVEALSRVPGERLPVLSRLAESLAEKGLRPAEDLRPGAAVSDTVGSATALAAWLRGGADSRPAHQPFRWIDLPALLLGPPALRRTLTAVGLPASPLARATSENDSFVGEADAGVLLVEAWLAGVASRPRRRLPAWMVPVLSRLAEDRIPEDGAERCGQLLAALGLLAAQAREPWARAMALEAIAEGRLWHLAAEDGAAPIRRAALALVEARSDLALAAGLFRRAGWNVRADACERRWARLALPVLGPQVAETVSVEASPAWTRGARFDGSPPGLGVPIEGRPAGHDARSVAALAEPDLGRVQRAFAEVGFLTCDRRTLRDLAPLLLLAAAPLPVLILGESGTGKEVLARAIHRWSRLRGELVAIHCGAIPRDLLESELFGHARGAFTGAAGEKPGLIEAADGGTLFLDEIGEMGAEAQMKMLRVLENGEVRRLGELRPRRAALRLVAATHRDLEAEVDRGGFRLDLFHRIRGVVVRVRPLRERRGDIPLLAGKLLAASGGAGLRFSPEGLACLVAHAWPGNVRELRVAVQRAAHLARALGHAVIGPSALGLAPAAPAASAEPDMVPPASPPATVPACVGGDFAGGETAAVAAGWSVIESQAADGSVGRVSSSENGAIPDTVRVEGLDAYLDGIERRIIVRALEDRGWNRTHAARDLGGLSRTTLLGKIRRLGIDGDALLRTGADAGVD
jgi:DNA-binding NtrC family response regulator